MEKYLTVSIIDAPLPAPRSTSRFSDLTQTIQIALPAIKNGGTKRSDIVSEFLPRMLGRPVDGTKVKSWKGTQSTASELTVHKDYIMVEFFETACCCMRDCCNTKRDF
eukprot:SAG31_NODE_35442_length_323_cov_0.687500_1_plen_107_part_11